MKKVEKMLNDFGGKKDICTFITSISDTTSILADFFPVP